MHLEILLKSAKKTLALPIHYNHLVQAALYNSIEPELADFLHEKGYNDEKRSFRLFSFSLLQGLYRMNQENKTITFEDEIKLTVSSPVDEFCRSLVNTLLSRGKIKLGTQEASVESVQVRKFIVEKPQITLKSLSPIVLYSTMLRPDGRKYTVYFQAGDPDYERLLSGNLQKKYRAFVGMEPPAENVQARALGQQKMIIISYKDTIIKGYTGKLFLSGPIPLLQLAVDGGLGSKNSQGFGCVIPIELNKD